MVLTPMSIIIREIINDRKNNINTISAFISDQSPAKADIKYWTTFLESGYSGVPGYRKSCF